MMELGASADRTSEVVVGMERSLRTEDTESWEQAGEAQSHSRSKMLFGQQEEEPRRG
jgi:hypothetical protein